MTEWATIAAPPLLRAVAATAIGETRLGLPSAPLDQRSWEHLAQRADYERVSGLLVAVSDAGQLPVTADQWADAKRLHRAALETCLLLEAELLQSASIFDDAGVEYRVLKGTSFAHLDYPDPSLRVFADVDLLVAGEQFDRASEALVEAGYVRHFREVRRGFDRRFGKGVAFTNPSGLETDLHRTLVMGPYGLWLDPAVLWSSEAEFEVGGRRFAGLDDALRFLHACYHLALGTVTPRLLPACDLARMLTRPDRPVDVDRARAVAAQWRGEAVVARAVVLTWDSLELPDTELSRWARGVQPDVVHQRALRTYLDPQMGYAARSAAALRAVPGLRAKAAFASALAFPDRSYASGRHRSRVRRWGAALRQVARLYRPRSRQRPDPAG